MLEYQDAYMIHRPARRRFLHNPYTVSNIRDVWECDILNMQSLAKYNDTYRYILSVIDVFSNKSTSGAHKDEERPCSHLGVSIPIT